VIFRTQTAVEFEIVRIEADILSVSGALEGFQI
jgi:hypothetical protein